MQPSKIPIILIVGPTAVGKTQMAIELADIFPNIEIISADSRQIYKYMDIGTAKPSVNELKSLPHHFINIKNPDDPFNAGEYGRQGRSLFFKLKKNGKIPLVVGGSGLYIRSLIDGLFQGQVSDIEIKNMLQQRVDSEGLSELYKELKRNDPETAATVHENDRQRIVRALEVWQITGESISKLRKKLNPEINLRPIVVGLNRNREKLYKIINNRVHVMIDKGLINEVKKLRETGYHSNLQSQKTVGYQEIHNLFDGFHSEEEAVNLIKRNTRRFAKRQLTWFNRDDRTRWFFVDDNRTWKLAKRYLSEFIKVADF